MTAEWWPWYDFSLVDRVPARAFAPVPAVDAGLLEVERRAAPLVPVREAGDYRTLVRRVFAARGRGVVAMAERVVGAPRSRAWAAERGIEPDALPRTVTAEQWAALHAIARRGR